MHMLYCIIIILVLINCLIFLIFGVFRELAIYLLEGLLMCSALVVKEEIKKELVTVEDLARFMKMLDCTDGGPTWQPLMEKSVPGMAYQAWRREPEVSILYIGCCSSSWCYCICLLTCSHGQ